MSRRREAAAQPQSALAQAQSREHSSRVEAGRQRGQVLLGQRVVEAQGAPTNVEEDPEGFDLRRDSAERLPAPIIHCTKRYALPFEPPAARTIQRAHT